MTYEQKQITIDTYNKSARGMADKFNNLGGRREDIEQGLSYITKDNPKVVELGCGNGRDAAIILEHTTDYLGMDASAELLAIARVHVPTGEFVLSDFEHFDFPSHVDAIFAFASLIHADKTLFADVLKKAHDALLAGGVFFISLKHGHYHQFSKEDEFGPRTLYYYDEATLHELSHDHYDIVDEKVYELRGQQWYDIILRKT